MFPWSFIKNNMNEWRYCVSLGGIPIEIKSRYEFSSCDDFLTNATPVASVSLNDKHNKEMPGRCCSETDVRNIELFELAAAASNKLLPYNSSVFHGTAFIWREKAWIFTAPSGTGKTTQYALWKKLYGEEIQLINGDKPILSVNGEGIFYVYSSPWCGKEHMYQLRKAPLGGIIYLKRAKENCISCLEKGKAALLLYNQFIFCPDDNSTVLKVCELEDQLLSSCMIWLLENRGDEASAEMTRNCLVHYLEEKHS